MGVALILLAYSVVFDCDKDTRKEVLHSFQHKQDGFIQISCLDLEFLPILYHKFVNSLVKSDDRKRINSSLANQAEKPSNILLLFSIFVGLQQLFSSSVNL